MTGLDTLYRQPPNAELHRHHVGPPRPDRRRVVSLQVVLDLQRFVQDRVGVRVVSSARLSTPTGSVADDRAGTLMTSSSWLGGAVVSGFTLPVIGA